MIPIITKELVDRINALARKQRAEGLTPAEKEEQHQLRQQYLKGIRGQVIDQLSRIKFVEDENCGCNHDHHGTNSCGCGQNHQKHANHKKSGCGCSNHDDKGHIH
ncbi:protein of unknown function DUF896 [Desulforamulus reducens MI-1]|uniref:UPF0291 protein Dred_0755 n=1 Tax=Desulforamulus reducens (strain ATCC BAA-1160 / DSM 100696 / MI-1) TaxID=349161 RepID=A4J2J0_DESRM|nr:protein of unknown function DUF896 [Desulforamulus reducens MI-1]